MALIDSLERQSNLNIVYRICNGTLRAQKYISEETFAYLETILLFDKITALPAHLENSRLPIPISAHLNLTPRHTNIPLRPPFTTPRAPWYDGLSTPIEMPSAAVGFAPDLEKYLKTLRGQPLDSSVENLIS